jgi:hypothetical protein
VAKAIGYTRTAGTGEMLAKLGVPACETVMVERKTIPAGDSPASLTTGKALFLTQSRLATLQGREPLPHGVLQAQRRRCG